MIRKLNNVILVWCGCDVREVNLISVRFECGVIRKWCDVKSVWYECDELWYAWHLQDMVWCHMKVIWRDVCVVLIWHGMMCVLHITSRHFFKSYHITPMPHAYQVTCFWYRITFASGHVSFTSDTLDSYHTHITTYHAYIKSHQFHISSHSYRTIFCPQRRYHGASHKQYVISLQYFVTNTSQHIVHMTSYHIFTSRYASLT